MLEKILKIVFPNTESSFFYYIVPVIFSLLAIVAIWILFLSLSQLMKLKIEKWKETKYQKSLFRLLLITEKELIEKSLTALRIVLSLKVFLVLLSHTLGIISTELKLHLNSTTPNSDRIMSVLAQYSGQATTGIDFLSSLIVNVFFTILIAIWCLKILEKGLEILINQPSKDKNNIDSARALAKKNTLKTMTSHVLKIIVYIIAVFTILQNLGINIAALLATAGVASLGISFGAQSLVKDFIAGFFIIFEDQFAMGDNVELNTTGGIYTGSIEKMTLRMVRMRSSEGSLVTISNGDIRSAKNFTTDWSRIEFKYGMELNSNLENAALIFREEVERLCADYPKEIIGAPDIRPMEKIADFENKSTVATFRFFMKTTSTLNRVKLEMEFNKRLITRFKAENVYAKED